MPGKNRRRHGATTTHGGASRHRGGLHSIPGADRIGRSDEEARPRRQLGDHPQRHGVPRGRGVSHPAPHVLGPHPDGEGLPVLRGPPVHRRPPLRRAAQGNRGVPVRIRQPAGHVAARGQTAFPHNRSGGRGRLPVPGQGEGAARADRPRLIHVAADRGHHRRRQRRTAYARPVAPADGYHARRRGIRRERSLPRAHLRAGCRTGPFPQVVAAGIRCAA